MTLLGYLFVIISLWCLTKPLSHLYTLLIVSCVFEGSSIMNIGSKSILPHTFVSTMFILKSFFIKQSKFNQQGSAQTKKRRILVFLLYCFSLTLICPLIFEDTRVIDINGVSVEYKKLYLSLSNIAQVIYVVVNLLTLLCIVNNSRFLLTFHLVKSYKLAMYIAVIFGYWEFISKTTGLIPFPTSLLLNNISYGLDGSFNLNAVSGGFLRMSSIFVEASVFGPYVAGCFWANFFIRQKKRILLVESIFLLGCVILSFSTTGYVTWVSGLLLYCIFKPNKMRTLFLVLFMCIILYLVLLYSNILDIISIMLLNKSDSVSGIQRTQLTLASIEIFCNSYGLGIGLGSSRGNSFIVDLFASIGFTGVILFFRLYKSIIIEKIYVLSSRYISILGIAILIGQCVAIPDFSYSIMWMTLFLGAGVNYSANYKDENIMHYPCSRRQQTYSSQNY